MLVGLDTETFPITRREPVPRLVCVTFDGGTPSTRGIVKHDDPALQSIIVDLLTHHDVTLTRACFDALALLRWRPELWPLLRAAYERDAVHDVSIRGRLLANAYGNLQGHKFDLQTLAANELGWQLDKGADTYRLRYGELSDTPLAAWPREAIDYAMLDAVAAREIHIRQDAQRQHAGLGLDIFANEGHQVRTSLALAAQSVRGMLTDHDNAVALDAKLRGEIEELTWWTMQGGLAREAGPKRARKIVKTRKAAETAVLEYAAALGHTAKVTATGKAAVSKSALADLELPPRKLDASGRITWIHPLDAYRELGARQALHSKWFPLLLQPQVWTNYTNPVASGRTSSWGSPDGDFADCSENLQNLPRPTTYPGFRECFRPRDGHIFGVSDWSGIEFGTHAQNELDMFGRSTLAELLAADVDVHAATGMAMLGLPREAYDKGNKQHKAARQDAKPVGFGDMGMLGPRKLVVFARDNYGVRISEQQARAHLDARHRMLPEIVAYHQFVKSECPFGYRATIVQPKSLRIRGGCMATDAANTRFQGLAADVAGSALWALFCASLDPSSMLFGCYQVLFVHDENVTELPDDDSADARLAEQDAIMIGAFRAWCPDVRIKVESGKHRRYTK